MQRELRGEIAVADGGHRREQVLQRVEFGQRRLGRGSATDAPDGLVGHAHLVDARSPRASNGEPYLQES